jgi:uncharacterized protein (TIGR01244 family)
MELKFLSDDYAVTAQISIDDIEALKAQGFEMIIATRPDGEEATQPAHALLEEQAAKNGMKFAVVPMSGPQVNDDLLAQFKNVLSPDLKTLGFCRTGNRASILWNAVNQ